MPRTNTNSDCSPNVGVRLADTPAGTRASRPAGARGKSAFGYTLIELMITVLIVAVLGSVTANGIGNWLQRRLHQTDVQEIVNLLYNVRQRSVVRGEFSMVEINNHRVNFSMSYGRDPMGMAGSGFLDLEDTLQILQPANNAPYMLVLFYTNSGRLVSAGTGFRVCSDALDGEQPVLISVSQGGQVFNRRGVGPACP